MKTTADDIRSIMSEAGLTRRNLCELLGLTVAANGSHGTIDMWLSEKNVPPAYLAEYLRLKLGAGLTVWGFEQVAGTRFAATRAEAIETASNTNTENSVRPFEFTSPQQLANFINRILEDV